MFDKKGFVVTILDEEEFTKKGQILLLIRTLCPQSFEISEPYEIFI